MIVQLVDAPEIIATFQFHGDEIQSLWNKAKTSNPSLYDAPLLHFIGMRNRKNYAVIETTIIWFRHLFAQRMCPDLSLGIFPVGVSSVTYTNEGLLCLGKRSSLVNQYPGYWELVPSGHFSISAEMIGSPNPIQVIEHELEEELGVDKRRIRRKQPIGLLQDHNDPVVDVCYLLETDLTSSEILNAMKSLPGQEYDEFVFLSLKEASSFAKEQTPMVPTSRTLLYLL